MIFEDNKDNACVRLGDRARPQDLALFAYTLLLLSDTHVPSSYIGCYDNNFDTY
jgi:hypothetical protein